MITTTDGIIGHSDVFRLETDYRPESLKVYSLIDHSIIIAMASTELMSPGYLLIVFATPRYQHNVQTIPAAALREQTYDTDALGGYGKYYT